MSANISIYCDFDGTVTFKDTTDFLLERLADPSWRAIEAEWEEGLIGSRECMSRQIPLIQGGWDAVETQLREVKVDPSFKGFAAWFQENTIPLFIVSEGMDRVIHYLLSREDIVVDGVLANRLHQDKDEKLSLTFPAADPNGQCPAGLCKCRITDLLNTQHYKVVIGDGRSDYCWAPIADLLFAKSKLLKHCEQSDIPCIPFDNFGEIQGMLIEHIAVRAEKLITSR